MSDVILFGEPMVMFVAETEGPLDEVENFTKLLAGADVNVTSVPSHMYPTKAVRPKNSRLSKKSLDEAGFRRLPTWQDAVGRFLKELKESAE